MGMEPLSRAEFLKLLALGGAGITLLGGPEKALAALAAADDRLDQAALDGDAEAARGAGTVIAVAKGTSASSNVKRAIAAVGGMRKYVGSGDVVVVKPNVGWPRAAKYAATTNPAVVGTVVSLARQAGAKKVLVMDNPVSTSPSTCYSVSGIASAVRAAGGSMVVMGSSGYKSYAMPGHLLKNQPLYAAIVNADVLINVPIAKTHDSTGLTLAGKNLMGCTSDRQRMHALGLSQGIAELNAKLRPALTVLDAMHILVRNGPSGGNLGDVVTKNTVVAGHDWVAVDAWACRLFGFPTSRVPYIRAAANMGLGTANLSSVTVKNV